MDLEQLNKIDTTKADEVKALQSFLKTRGYYSGLIDGKWGGGTTTGAGKLREDLKSQSDRDLELEKTRTAGKVAESEGKKAENDPKARLTKTSMELLPYVAGIGTGTAAGYYGFGKPYAKADVETGGAVSRLVKAMDVDPQSKQEQLNRLNTRRNVRNTAQFAAPALLGGAGYATREFIAPMFSDPQTQDIIRTVGTGENAAAMTLGVHQLIDTLRRGNPNDPVDEARIRSGAKANSPAARALAGSHQAAVRPELPPPEAPALRTPSDRLKSAARTAGAPSKGLNKTTAAAWLTAANINDANRAAVAAELGVGPGQRIATAVKRLSASRTASSLIAPLAAAGLAYDATTSDAEAAGDTSAEARTKGAVAGTGAAGLTAAGGYGLSKLLEKAPNVARAMGIGGGMTMPLMAMDIGPGTPEEANRERSRLAVNHPWLARNVFGLTDEMGQAPPERNMGKTDEFATARSLQIPEGIPSPNPDGSSPYPGLVSAMSNGPRAATPPPPMLSRQLIEAMTQGR